MFIHSKKKDSKPIFKGELKIIIYGDNPKKINTTAKLPVNLYYLFDTFSSRKLFSTNIIFKLSNLSIY